MGWNKQRTEGIYRSFSSVSKFWQILNFEVREIFGSGENVAVFGSSGKKWKLSTRLW
jgi:hypothetical protein